MSGIKTKAALSPARKRLVDLMQGVNYGRIEGLCVHNGEPVFDPPPIVLRLFMFGKDNGPNEICSSDNFALKNKVAELFQIFDRERSLSIKELFIDNGLPVHMSVTDEVRV